MIKRGFNKKRGQQTMSMPFGLIFSIMLIVIFIIVAIVVIRNFLSVGSCTEIGQFYTGLQKNVDNAFYSQESSFNFTVSLPSDVTTICFVNLSKTFSVNDDNARDLESFRFQGEKINLFLMPLSAGCDMPSKLIKHINIEEITRSKNPYCVSTKKYQMKIKKGFYDKLVSLV